MHWKQLWRRHREPEWSPTDWPLTFRSYSVSFRAYNTLRCSVIYDNHSQMPELLDRPSGEPPEGDWRKKWHAGYCIVPGRALHMLPAKIDWVSMDGEEHSESLVVQDMFDGRRILHNVPRDEISPAWVPRGHVEILVEINDRSICLYMRAQVPTSEAPEPENPLSYWRMDLVSGWSRKY